MSTIDHRLGRLLAGGGGVLLLASLFLPWADDAGGASRSGWQLAATSDVLFAVVAACGIAAALTGGRFGFFRPDLSLNATADILAVVATIVLGWLIVFDFPADASRAVGVYLALAGAIAVATGAGDFRVRSLFPELPEGDRPAG